MEEAAALRPRLNVLLSLANMQLKQYPYPYPYPYAYPYPRCSSR